MSGSTSAQIKVLASKLNALEAKVAAGLVALDAKIADHEKRIAHLELVVYGDPGTGIAVVPSCDSRSR